MRLSVNQYATLPHRRRHSKIEKKVDRKKKINYPTIMDNGKNRKENFFFGKSGKKFLTFSAKGGKEEGVLRGGGWGLVLDYTAYRFCTALSNKKAEIFLSWLDGLTSVQYPPNLIIAYGVYNGND